MSPVPRAQWLGPGPRIDCVKQGVLESVLPGRQQRPPTAGGGDLLLALSKVLKQPWWGLPGSSAGKEPAYNAGDLGLIPRSGRSPGRRAWLPTPVFLPGGSPWKEEPGGLQSMGCKVRYSGKRDYVPKYVFWHQVQPKLWRQR